MKNAKFLFDEKQSLEGMISVSQIQTFLSCAKKWKYNYIDNITPRVERAYLTVGKLCHKGMQTAMQRAWHDQKQAPTEDFKATGRWKNWMEAGLTAIDNEWVNYIESVPLLDEEVPELNQMYLDAVAVFTQAFEEFEPWKYRVYTLKKNGQEIPALELHFRVPCPPTKGLHGFIDAILYDTETDCLWCTDYKFRKSLSPDEDEAFNLQNSVYTYACQRLGIGITGTMTWQHINTPAAEPAVLKDGSFSRAKIKTTWEHYCECCVKAGKDPADYAEMEDKLKDIEWFRATYEYRNPETVERIWNTCVIPVASRIVKAHNKKAVNHPSLYPWNCKMCQYQSLCQAELRDYDVDAIRELEYVTRDRGDKKVVDSSEDSVI